MSLLATIYHTILHLIFLSGNSPAICEIWNTLEPNFQQVGYNTDVKICSKGKVYFLHKRSLYFTVSLTLLTLQKLPKRPQINF